MIVGSARCAEPLVNAKECLSSAARRHTHFIGPGFQFDHIVKRHQMIQLTTLRMSCNYKRAVECSPSSANLSHNEMAKVFGADDIPGACQCLESPRKGDGAGWKETVRVLKRNQHLGHLNCPSQERSGYSQRNAVVGLRSLRCYLQPRRECRRDQNELASGDFR